MDGYELSGTRLYNTLHPIGDRYMYIHCTYMYVQVCGHIVSPSGGRELEHFTTYEAHRAKQYVHICIINRSPNTNSNLIAAVHT